MDIGKLKHRVTIQEYKQGQQDPVTGDIISSWVTRYITWASVTGVSGRDFLAAGAEQSGTTSRFVIRRLQIDTSMRILLDGEVYNIKAVLPDNDKRQLTIMAEKGVIDD